VALGIGATVVIAFFVTPRWRLVLAVGLVIAFLMGAAYVRYSSNQNLVDDLFGFDGRLEIWSRALIAISDYPITGVSANGFRRVVHVLYPLFTIPPQTDLGHAHNHLLQVSLDLGLPGLISYFALWIISAALLWETWQHLVDRRARKHPYFALLAGLTGSLAAGWVFGLLDTVSLGSRPAFIWWILLSLVATVHYAAVHSGESLHRRRAASAVAAPPEAAIPRLAHPQR
jgi:O-antigen ligase